MLSALPAFLKRSCPELREVEVSWGCFKFSLEAVPRHRLPSAWPLRRVSWLGPAGFRLNFWAQGKGWSFQITPHLAVTSAGMHGLMEIGAQTKKTDTLCRHFPRQALGQQV